MEPTSNGLFDELSLLALLAVGAVSFGAAVIDGFGGAGVSLMLVPLLVPILGIKAAFPR